MANAQAGLSTQIKLYAIQGDRTRNNRRVIGPSLYRGGAVRIPIVVDIPKRLINVDQAICSSTCDRKWAAKNISLKQTTDNR